MEIKTTRLERLKCFSLLQGTQIRESRWRNQWRGKTPSVTLMRILMSATGGLDQSFMRKRSTDLPSVVVSVAMDTLANDYQKGCVELFPNIPLLINFSRQRCLPLTTGRGIAHALKQKQQIFWTSSQLQQRVLIRYACRNLKFSTRQIQSFKQKLSSEMESSTTYTKDIRAARSLNVTI